MTPAQRYLEDVRALLQQRLHGLLTSTAMFKTMEQARLEHQVSVHDAQRIIAEIMREAPGSAGNAEPMQTVARPDLFVCGDEATAP